MRTVARRGREGACWAGWDGLMLGGMPDYTGEMAMTCQPANRVGAFAGSGALTGAGAGALTGAGAGTP
jgi:hypothetical protein